MLPYEFHKIGDNPPVGDTDIETVEVLDSPTKDSVKPSQEPSGNTREETIEKF